MPCIRVQMSRNNTPSVDPSEILIRSSQSIADAMKAEYLYIMALWEPCRTESEGVHVDVMGIEDDELPDRSKLSKELEDLLQRFLPETQRGLNLKIREGQRSEWDAWEEDAVDGFQVIYGYYQAGREYKP